MTQLSTLARDPMPELSATRQMPAYINGPWVAETRDGSLYRIYSHADPDREIACIYSTRETAETDRANATAITQVPELLRLARVAAWLIDDSLDASQLPVNNNFRQLFDELTAVIGKAEGR